MAIKTYKPTITETGFGSAVVTWDDELNIEPQHYYSSGEYLRRADGSQVCNGMARTGGTIKCKRENIVNVLKKHVRPITIDLELERQLDVERNEEQAAFYAGVQGLPMPRNFDTQYGTPHHVSYGYKQGKIFASQQS